MDTPRRTQDQILDAAERLFGSRSYADVTINDVCRASGLPVGSVYHHFTNKAGLLAAVLERGRRAFFDALPQVDALTGDPYERVAAYYEIAAEVTEKHLPFLRLHASLTLQEHKDDGVLTILRKIERDSMDGMVAVIEPLARSCGVADAAGRAAELANVSIAFTAGLVVYGDATGMDIATGMRHLSRLVLTYLRESAAGSADDR